MVKNKFLGKLLNFCNKKKCVTDVCRLIGKRFVPLQVGYIIDLDRLLKYTQHTYTYLHLFSLTHINNLRRSNIPLRPLFLILFYHSSDFLFNVLIFMHRLSVILLKYWWIRPCFCNVFSLGEWGGGCLKDLFEQVFLKLYKFTIVFEYGFVTAIKYVDVCVCVYKYGCKTASVHTLKLAINFIWSTRI